MATVKTYRIDSDAIGLKRGVIVVDAIVHPEEPSDVLCEGSACVQMARLTLGRKDGREVAFCLECANKGRDERLPPLTEASIDGRRVELCSVRLQDARDHLDIGAFSTAERLALYEAVRAAERARVAAGGI